LCVTADGERGDVAREGDGELPVEVREEVAAARGLPAEADPEILRINGDEHEVSLAGEVAPQGLSELGARGEVDEAIPDVDIRTAVRACHDGFMPLGRRADFVDPMAIVCEHLSELLRRYP
jgi:hypothetical protein